MPPPSRPRAARRVDGTFIGTVATSGSMVVGPTGFVKCDLHGLKEFVCSGRLKGSVQADRVVLRGKAVVIGNVSARALVVGDRVTLVGELHVEPPAPDDP